MIAIVPTVMGLAARQPSIGCHDPRLTGGCLHAGKSLILELLECRLGSEELLGQHRLQTKLTSDSVGCV